MENGFEIIRYEVQYQFADIDYGFDHLTDKTILNASV